MLSLQITDIKGFMGHLLSKDTFDPFYMVESTIRMGITYQLDGYLNKDFYDSDTSLLLTRNLSFWKEVRPRVFDIIKGKRLPLSCKIILKLPDRIVTHLLQQSQSQFTEDDVEGLFLNILYHQQQLTITSGISYRTFSLDKSLEHAFDDYMKRFFTLKEIA